MKKAFIVIVECVQRGTVEDGSTKLQWAGRPANPLAAAVDRCNDGTATEDDYAALETVPLFDVDLDPNDTLEIVERSRFEWRK